MKKLFTTVLIIFFISVFSQKKEDYKREKYGKISRSNLTIEKLHSFLVDYKDSLDIAKSTENEKSVAYYSLIVSKIYYRLGGYNNSIDYGKLALSKYKNLNDTTYILLTLFNMGAIYGEVQEKEIAEEYFLEIEKLAIQANDSGAIANNYINLGTVFSTTNSEKAINYFKKAKQYYPKRENIKAFNFYLNTNIANVFFTKGEYNKAKDNYLYSYKQIDHNHFFYSSICNNISQTYQNLGMLDSALYYSNLALTKNPEMYTLDNLANTYYNLASIYLEKAKTDSSKKYLELYKSYSDSIILNKKVEYVSKLKVIHETDKLVNNIKEQKQELVKSRTRIVNMSIALGVIVLGLIIFVFYYRKLQISYKNIVKESVQAIKMEEQIASLENELNVEKSVSDKKDEINIENSDQIFNEILRLLEQEKLFTDEDFDVNKLADVLNTNRTYISKIINAKTNDSFVKFVNSYRIKEAKRLLIDESNNNLTLNAIGRMSGFKSSATFYRVFKQETGVTPSFFVKNKNV